MLRTVARRTRGREDRHASSFSCASAAAAIRLAGIGQLLLLSIPAEAKPDRGARLAIIKPERAKHMAGPARSAGAGRTERKGDIAKVGNKPCSINAFAPDVKISWITVGSTSVDRPTWPERIDRSRPQLLNMVIVAGHAFRGELCRGAETNAKSRRQGTRASPRSCPPPWMKPRALRLCASTGPQCP